MPQKNKHDVLRALPSVDACLKLCADNPVLAKLNPSKPLLCMFINFFLNARREKIQHLEEWDKIPEELNSDHLPQQLLDFVQKKLHSHLRHVLNATGVIIHTNMGRSVLADEAMSAVVDVCRGYSNLELDLETGERGDRYAHVEALLSQISGAEAALVVNNNAAAVFLVLNTFCAGGEVIIARGQLVEIGDYFRIPEIMQRSGAILREVGCTNRVHPEDYEKIFNDNTRALMRVHTSNYRIVGFHSDVSIQEMRHIVAGNSYRYNPAILIEDLGSGTLVDFTKYGLPSEPTVQSCVRARADIITFSGDKVLGGPQAGIILGKKELIAKIRGNPLTRAFRVDKMTMAALEATLRICLDENRLLKEIPTLRMITMTPQELQRRAKRLANAIRRQYAKLSQSREEFSLSLVSGESRVGGGAFPERPLPTTLVRIEHKKYSPDSLKKKLLCGNPPLLGRVEHDALHLDPRTLSDKELLEAAKAVAQALLPDQA